MELCTTPLEVAGLMRDGPLRKHRTGAAFLSLVAASNFLPWMELVGGKTATAELVSPAEYAMGFGSCLLAATGILLAWIAGHRRPPSERLQITRPRLLGLRLSISAATLNLLLAGLIFILGVNSSLGAMMELQVFAVVWFLLILPMEVLAAFSKGLASQAVPAVA